MHPRRCALHRLESTQPLGVLNLTVHDSSDKCSLLLIMCVDAPGSTTKSLSAGLFEVVGVDIPFRLTKILKKNWSDLLSF